jgi:hypothetical protein
MKERSEFSSLRDFQNLGNLKAGGKSGIRYMKKSPSVQRSNIVIVNSDTRDSRSLISPDAAKWKYYQSDFKRRNFVRNMPKKPFYKKKSLKYTSLVFLLLIIVGGICGGAVYHHETARPGYFPDMKAAPAQESRNPVPKPREAPPFIDKKKVQILLDSAAFLNLREHQFDMASRGHVFHIETTIDEGLQNFILEKTNGSISRYTGIIVMEPRTGRVLAMVGFDEDNPDNNPCIDNRFPAASVFKIVTAAAMIEKYGFDPDSEFAYSGRKHTLYKFQLKKNSNRGTRNITFAKSFAQSVNPVFGMMGVHYLGKEGLEEYAYAFGFNRTIGFEIPVRPSVITISDDDTYHWAEIASGFNRETIISPLHGALIASAIANRGQLIEPIIVDRIRDQNGDVVYQSRFTVLNRAISPESSGIIKQLMLETIATGTCRKAFKGYRSDTVLSKLNIGGKTGTISSKDRHAHYDWFVGFAEEKGGTEQIVISAVVAHGKLRGVRAKEYARMAIKEYFRSYFAKQGAKKSEKQHSEN